MLLVKRLGQWVKESASPLCMALIGDLGTGKTHMSQGIAKGLGVSEDITSSYIFSYEYLYDIGR